MARPLPMPVVRVASRWRTESSTFFGSFTSPLVASKFTSSAIASVLDLASSGILMFCGFSMSVSRMFGLLHFRNSKRGIVTAGCGGSNGNVIGPEKPSRNAHSTYPAQFISNRCVILLASLQPIWRSLLCGVGLATGASIKAFPGGRFIKGRNLSMSHTSRNRRRYFEALETRQMFAAHIVGDLASYATIQAAVNAAMPGAIINVDAGVYSELVTINKQLTVRGAQAG